VAFAPGLLPCRYRAKTPDIVIPHSVNGFALARMARLRRLDLKVLYTTAYDISGVEAIGKILRKPIPRELLAPEAGLALAGNGDLSS
jgi:hypothetical protein